MKANDIFVLRIEDVIYVAVACAQFGRMRSGAYLFQGRQGGVKEVSFLFGSLDYRYLHHHIKGNKCVLTFLPIHLLARPLLVWNLIRSKTLPKLISTATSCSSLFKTNVSRIPML